VLLKAILYDPLKLQVVCWLALPEARAQERQLQEVDMKKTGWYRSFVMVVILLGMSFTYVFAGTTSDTPIDQRLITQQKRIDDGIKSKQLTQDEAKTLQDNLSYIKQEEARLKAVGKLNAQENERLNKMLDQNSYMIQDKKTNPVKAMAPAPAAPVAPAALAAAAAAASVPAKPAAVSPAPAPAAAAAAAASALVKPVAASTAPAPAKPAAVSTAPVPGAAGVEQRFKNQEKRINDGIKSGQLTQSEAGALRDNLNYIKAEEARLKADGRLDKSEQQRLTKMLDQNSNMIENKKTNPVKVLKDSHLQGRFESQQEKIDRGVISGALTKDETKIVQDNLTKIKAEEARLKKEGKLTTEEKNRLEKMLDQNNDMIQDKTKNPVKRM